MTQETKLSTRYLRHYFTTNVVRSRRIVRLKSARNLHPVSEPFVAEFNVVVPAGILNSEQALNNCFPQNCWRIRWYLWQAKQVFVNLSRTLNLVVPVRRLVTLNLNINSRDTHVSHTHAQSNSVFEEIFGILSGSPACDISRIT